MVSIDVASFSNDFHPKSLFGVCNGRAGRRAHSGLPGVCGTRGIENYHADLVARLLPSEPECPLLFWSIFQRVVLGVVGIYPPGSPCQAEITTPLAMDPEWFCFMPDPTLLNRQWITYGICSGVAPHEYFAGLEQIFRDVKIPPRFIQPNEHFRITTLEVKRAFTAVNHLEDADVAVSCEHDFLSNVMISVARQLNRGRVWTYFQQVSANLIESSRHLNRG
jgi:hypothetical protein